MSDEAQQAWDQQPGEPTNWFVRFEMYRLAGPDRSLLAVWRSAQISPKKPNNLPSSWKDAAERWQWKERAEAYDLFELQQIKDEREQKYRDELNEHRERAKKLAIRNNAIADKALEIIKARLDTLHANQIEAKQIPMFLRAAADLAERALNAEAHALGLDELIGTMSDGDDQSSE